MAVDTRLDVSCTSIRLILQHSSLYYTREVRAITVVTVRRTSTVSSGRQIFLLVVLNSTTLKFPLLHWVIKAGFTAWNIVPKYSTPYKNNRIKSNIAKNKNNFGGPEHIPNIFLKYGLWEDEMFKNRKIPQLIFNILEVTGFSTEKTRSIIT